MYDGNRDLPPQACLKKGKVFRKLSQRTHGFARGRRNKELWGGGCLEPRRRAKKRKKGCQVVLGHYLYGELGTWYLGVSDSEFGDVREAHERIRGRGGSLCQSSLPLFPSALSTAEKKRQMFLKICV